MAPGNTAMCKGFLGICRRQLLIAIKEVNISLTKPSFNLNGDSAELDYVPYEIGNMHLQLLNSSYFV